MEFSIVEFGCHLLGMSVVSGNISGLFVLDRFTLEQIKLPLFVETVLDDEGRTD